MVLFPSSIAVEASQYWGYIIRQYNWMGWCSNLRGKFLLLIIQVCPVKNKPQVFWHRSGTLSFSSLRSTQIIHSFYATQKTICLCTAPALDSECLWCLLKPSCSCQNGKKHWIFAHILMCVPENGCTCKCPMFLGERLGYTIVEERRQECDPYNTTDQLEGFSRF